MSAESEDQRLSRIATLWSLMRQAHQGGDVDARQALLERYAGAVHRYLCGALHGAAEADDLFQEFALRFLRGDFAGADPGRGRFRDYVKSSLFRLVADYHRRERRHPGPLPNAEPAAPPDDAESAFTLAWREELMRRAWEALKAVESAGGPPVYSVLRLRTEQPALSSAELACEVGRRLNRHYSVDAIRQALHRARERFIDLLVDEIARSLEDPSTEDLEQELLNLDLYERCRAALNRRAGGGR